MQVLEEKRKQPGDDLISALVEAEVDGRLEPEESLVAATGFGFAAFDTTRNLLANGTALLAQHPDQREMLIQEPALIPNAIEEMLRCESPAQVEPRRVAAPVEFHGVELPVGDELLLYLGSANRDERKWDDPERFDVRRACRDHLAFGHGLHLCVGQHLARLEARVYFETLLERMPGYRVGETRHFISPWARSLVTLPVEY
jgi:cytochrome P450